MASQLVVKQPSAPRVATAIESTWPRWRFAQRTFAGPWFAVAAVSDEDLGRDGFKLGSPIRDATALRSAEREELLEFIQSRVTDLTPTEKARECTLLARCPYETLPPLDFDVAPGVSQDDLHFFVRRFCAAFEEAELGVPAIRTTGGRGIHGDLAAPGVASPLLLLAYREAIREIAVTLQIPLLSDHLPKDGRPDVVLDDTLFNRQPEARGVLWRLIGVKREKGGAKLPLDVDFPPPIGQSAEFPYGRPAAGSAARVAWWVKLVEERRAVELRTDAAAVPTVPDSADAPRPASRKAPLQLGPGGLPQVSRALASMLPPSGQRHEFRLAAAGWLLRKGVPLRTAARALVAANDPHDALAVVRTTAARLDAGLPALGIKRLHKWIGDEGVKDLKRALNRDLAKHGHFDNLARYLTEDERAVLLQAAQLASDADNEPAKKALQRGAWCSKMENRGDCNSCGNTGRRHFLVAEKPTCPHCACSRARDLATWMIARWPTKLMVAVRKVTDDSAAAALKAEAYLKKRIAKFARTDLRWFRSPGYVVAISANPEAMTGVLYAFDDQRGESVAWMSRFKALSIILPMLTARAKRIRGYLAEFDAAGLASDDWVARILDTHAGVKAREALPWPSKTELRLLAKNAARQRQGLPQYGSAEEAAEEAAVSPCCHSPMLHHLVHNGKVIGRRSDHPWRFEEAFRHRWAYDFGFPGIRSLKVIDESSKPTRKRGYVYEPRE